MKVRKVQLCSSAKEGNHSEEWGTDNKDCVEETSISSPETVDKEGHMFTTAAHDTQPLAMAVTTQGNSDILLSNVQLVSDIQQPVIWPSDGILRQALMTPEKNIKCEEKPCQSSIENCTGSASSDFTTVTSSCSTYSSLVTINVTPQQALTTTPGTSQVIMMGELESSQIILTGEGMPTTWQNSERKEVTEATCVTSCTVPVVSSRSFNEPTQLAINEQTSEILVNNQGTQFSTLGRISVLNQSVLPSVIETHNKKNGHEVINASDFGSSNKKNYTKFNKTNKKIQKKVNSNEKRLLVKPTSSLLSPVALNYQVVDSKNTVLNVVTSSGPVVSNGELLGSVLTDLERPSSPIQIVPNVEYTIKGTPKMVDSQLPVSSPSVIIASESNSFGGVSSVNAHQNLNIDHLTVNTKNGYQQCLDGNSEDSHMVNYNNHNIITHTGTDTSSVLTSNSSPSTTTTVTTSMPNQVRILNLNSPTLIQDSILVSSVNRMITAEAQPALNHQRILTSEDQDLINNSDHHTSNLIVGGEFHQQNSEVILSPDMEHHGNEIQSTQNDGTYTTQGYTAHILSQLSNASTLPAISSSQVSSVLSALEPNKPASNMNTIDNLGNCKARKTTIKNENVSAEFVKTENSGDCSGIKKKKRSTEQKWKICELNKHTCYRCSCCMFISLRSNTVDEHFAQEHDVVRSDLVNKQLTKRQIKCIGCDNVFFSKHALQVHLLQDHSVFGSELPELLNLVMTANKVVRECIRTVVVNEGTSAAAATSANVIIPVSVHSSCTTTTSLQPAPSKQVPTLSTPLFCLFDNVSSFANKENPQLVPVKKDTETFMTEEEGDNVKKKRQQRGPQNYRRIKSKLKIDDIKLEIKDTNQKCSLNGCTVRLQEQSNMDYHRKCHSENGSESEAFTCPECSHKSPHWSSLTVHLWKLHSIDIELFSCDKCNYKTNSHSKLMNLHRRIHGDERPFLCDLCGKGFKTTKQLRNHKAMHKKNRAKGKSEDDSSSQQKFPCVICGRTFIDRRVLRLHTENVHNKLKLFVCSFCEHAASSRSSLRMHIRQHTGEKPFSCEECEYTTSDHNSLRRHKMRHSGTKPYRCPHCTYACIQSSTYKVHLRTKHPGLCEGLMYSCSLCSFHTVKKDNFLTHSADHALGVDPLRGRRKAVNTTSAQETQNAGNTNNATTTNDNSKNPVIVTVVPEETVCVQDYTEELIVPEVSGHG